MRRRTFLRTLGITGTSLGFTAGTVSGHPTPEDATTGSDPSPTSTPTAAEPLGTLDLDAAFEAVVSADGTTTYVATGDGFAVVDISDPASPQLLASRTGLLAAPEGDPIKRIQDLAVSGSRVLVAGPAHPSDGGHGLVVFDVSDRADPEQIASYAVDSTIHNCDFDGRYAYLTANSLPGNPLLVVDTETEEEVARWSLLSIDDQWDEVSEVLWNLHDVQVQDGRAYLAHWDAGTVLLDISTPAEPAVLSQIRGQDPDRLTDIDNPVTEARHSPGNDHFVTVDDDGTLLGVGSESWPREDDQHGGASGIELYDISDPTAPASLATIEPPVPAETDPQLVTTAHNFELTDGRCYSAWYQAGVRVHDLSDPTAPREIYAWQDRTATAFWTAQRSANCFVASSTNALPQTEMQPRLYTFPDPERQSSQQSPSGGARPDSTTTDTNGGTALGAGGDGFGVAAALSAVGLWAWRRGRRNSR